MTERAVVLAIDDEAGMRDLLSWELSHHGFEVEIAETGAEAIQAMRRRKFDVVITDLKMPGLDGVQTTAAVRAMDPDIEVIVATGYASLETAIACMRLGAFDYIQKPYDPHELKLQLDRAIHKRRLQGSVALYEASRALLATPIHADIVRLVLELGRPAFRADGIVLLLGSPESDQCAAYRQPGDTHPSNLLLLDLARRAAAMQTPLRIPDQTGAVVPEALTQEGYASAMAYALAGHGQVHGCLVVLRAEGSPSFAQSELDRGAVFAAQLTLSLDNATLYERLDAKVGEVLSAKQALEVRTCELENALLEQRKAEESFRYLATHDQLTSLPNRALLDDRLNQSIARAKRSKARVALLLLDLDNFKEINDTLGHESGDLLLKSVATRFARCVREYDTVARMGGDEFIIILGDLQSVSDVKHIVERILGAFATEFTIGGRSVRIAASIGISFYPDDADEIEVLLKDADMAMYSAKNAGGNRFCFFASAMSRDMEERTSMTKALRAAIEEQQFVLHYQPLAALGTGSVVGAEALLRWRHPDEGLVAPMTFLPLAEASGLIVPIGEWVLKTACWQNRRWQEEGLPPISISVNVSPRQFREPRIAVDILRILEETQLDPKYLWLEITETTAMEDVEASVRILGELREHGITLVVDDFGSGYSSLNWLKRLPVQVVKIDRFFMQHIGHDVRDATVVKAIVAIAHSMGIQVVAEGIESPEQLELLRSLKWSQDEPLVCDHVQGFLLSKPVPSESFRDFLTTRTQGEAWLLPLPKVAVQ